MLACPAISASTRTPTPFALNSVSQVLLPLWLVAPTMPALVYSLCRCWVAVLAVKCEFFCVLNRWCSLLLWQSSDTYLFNCCCMVLGTKIRRARLDFVIAAARTISAFTVYCSTIELGSAYHHLNDTIRLNNAEADYRLDSDVTIRPVWTKWWIVLTRFRNFCNAWPAPNNYLFFWVNLFLNFSF